MDHGKLASEVAKISWFHTFNFGNGIVTSGYDNSYKRVRTLHLPEDLGGMTVLDIGSWDGFFAFEAERRGASRVLATDSFCWSGDGWGTKDGFNLARKVLNSKVEDLEIDVLDLSPEKVGTFDLVLCLGVLYHMRNPLLALERVYSVAKHQLILDTHRTFGYTAVLVSHEIPKVFDVATRVAMIHEGTIVGQGTPEEILKSSDPLIRQFIEGRLDGPIHPI